MDVVPTFKTRNERMCLLLPDGRLGYLLTRDAERLQARCPCPLVCSGAPTNSRIWPGCLLGTASACPQLVAATGTSRNKHP